MEIKFKEFRPTSWAINNKSSIYVVIIILAIFGMITYSSIPKEQIPDIIIPKIIVSTVYPGTSPGDMEKLVTRPLEKNIKSITGVKTIESNSVQDFSSIVVEFQTSIEVEDAKQKVKDAVDKTKKDLPNNLPADPQVSDIDLSQIPIMFINISGDYSLDRLKEYAEIAQERIEALPQITRVDIVGALDREILIDVDMYKMQAASVTLNQIESAVAYNNTTVSGGSIDMHGMKRSIRISGEIPDVETIRNIVIGSSSGALVKINDIARVTDGFHDRESYSYLNGKNVVTLNVIKKSGENLLEASDEINSILKELQKEKYPKDLQIVNTGEQSRFTRNTLHDLNNTIIIGFILVVLVLMFFMGLTNSVFVGLSVPLSMALAVIVLPWIGFTMNMLVMFSFLFALGIVVDDAIVVIENTHRIHKTSGLSIKKSAKMAAGEVFLPIFSGTLTTLAPFFPLAFWPGVVGEFMFYIPITIILTLFSSLIVAYIINPVFAVDFMKEEDETHALPRKRVYRNVLWIVAPALILYLFRQWGFANFLVLFAILYVLHNLYGFKMLMYFQHKALPKIMEKYESALRWVIVGSRPYRLFWGLVGLFIFSIVLLMVFPTKVIFFPDNEPNSLYTYIKLPVGTDVKVTDSVTRLVEKKLMKVLGDSNYMVESVISNVALGASESPFEMGVKSNKGKVTVNFVEFAKREGQETTPYMDKFRDVLKDVPGADISVGQSAMGPPTGKPINIEVSGDDLEDLIAATGHLMSFIDSMDIPGIEKLKTDFDRKKPELVVEVDRQRANYEGISTGQVGMEIRTSMLGKEVSKFRDGEDQYPIQLRYNEYLRNDIDRLMNLKITYRDMNSGKLRQIPLSSVARVVYQNSYGGISRKDSKRSITIYSNVLSGYSPNQIVPRIRKALPLFGKPDGVDIKITGEQEDQKESTGFLGKALMLSLMIILLILITQFNSIWRPFIILTEVVFSVIGVFLGIVIFRMDFSIIMTGMGVVALAGIVVRNGILLVEFTDELRQRGMHTREAIVQAGKIRITPVLLTAATTILGLIPLAVGLNIDFVTMFTEFNPHIHFGGDNVTFFGKLAWTIIFGLTFATFLTLIMIPVMYFIGHSMAIRAMRALHRFRIRKN